MAQSVKNMPAIQETQVQSLAWEDPLEKEMATLCSILPGKSHGQGRLEGYSPWGHKESLETKQQLISVAKYPFALPPLSPLIF